MPIQKVVGATDDLIHHQLVGNQWDPAENRTEDLTSSWSWGNMAHSQSVPSLRRILFWDTLKLQVAESLHRLFIPASKPNSEARNQSKHVSEHPPAPTTTTTTMIQCVCFSLWIFFNFFFFGILSRSIVSALLASSLSCILVGAALLFVWASRCGKHKHTWNCCPSVCVFHASVSLYVLGSISGKHHLVLLLKDKKKNPWAACDVTSVWV